MSDIYASIAEAVRKRTASATLGTYLFFWLSSHWQGIVAVLFVSEDNIFNKYHLLKSEYLNDGNFFGYHSTLWGFIDPSFIWSYIWPAIATFLFIWVLPGRILIHFYRQEQRFKNQKRRVRYEEEIAIDNIKERASKKSEAVLEAEIKLADVKRKAEKNDPEILWKNEFEKMIENKRAGTLQDIIECIYEHRGFIEVGQEYEDDYYQLKTGSLVYADTHELVEIASNNMKLTAKGRFIVSLFTDGDRF